MRAGRTFATEIRSRGQLTIPKKIRDLSRLEEGQAVSLIPIGDAVLVAPKRLDLDEARTQVRRIMKAANVSVEDLLEGLKEERASLFDETYGKEAP